MSMVIIVVHQTQGRLWLTLWTAEEDGGGLARRGVVILHGSKASTGQAYPMAEEHAHTIGPITHAPNGRQGQYPGLTPVDLV